MSQSVWATAVVAAEPEAEVRVKDTETAETAATGPTEPDPDSIPAPAGNLLPVKKMPNRSSGTHYYMAAHGGAGATTLAQHDTNGADAGGYWPSSDQPQNVVVTARETCDGLTAARTVAQQWGSGNAPETNLLALVLVAAQPGKVPSELRRDLKLTAGTYPRVYRVPWDPARITSPVEGSEPSKQEAKIIRTINKVSKGTP